MPSRLNDAGQKFHEDYILVSSGGGGGGCMGNLFYYT